MLLGLQNGHRIYRGRNSIVLILVWQLWLEETPKNDVARYPEEEVDKCDQRRDRKGFDLVLEVENNEHLEKVSNQAIQYF